MEGNIKPAPKPDDGGGDSGGGDSGSGDNPHVVDPEGSDFARFVEDNKVFLIICLVIFIVLATLLAIAYYCYDKKRRKTAYMMKTYSAFDRSQFNLDKKMKEVAKLDDN